MHAPRLDATVRGGRGRDIIGALRAAGVGTVDGGPSLEVEPTDSTPRLETASPIEGIAVVARAVQGEPTVGFRAFLDGIQRSHVRAYSAALPLVHGAVAAAIRQRSARRLHIWETPYRSHACYAPVGRLDARLVAALSGRCEVVDTLRDAEVGDAVHPADFAALALTAIQRRRERAEVQLAEAWASRGDGPLLIDGGIAGSETIARSDRVVGAVKSHRTLYVAGDSLGVVLGLREGERTTAVVLSSPRRVAVATWYLRLRSPEGRGPLFGLVRVEATLGGAADITERADRMSRWLLAERAPIALPDARWDVMVYGIRECEAYLSSILL